MMKQNMELTKVVKNFQKNLNEERNYPHLSKQIANLKPLCLCMIPARISCWTSW